MENTMGLKRNLSFLHYVAYVLIIIEFILFLYADLPIWGHFSVILERIGSLPFFSNLLYSKLVIFGIICLVSFGTLSKKKPDINVQTAIVLPLTGGLVLFFGSLAFYGRPAAIAFYHTSWFDLLFMVATFLGAVMISVALDNISKILHSNLGKDKFNIEEESFMQQVGRKANPYSVNIPMMFYYKKQVHRGFINVVNPFRGTLLIGTPGSGKSFGVVNPFIRQLLAKEFAMCVYDFKFPDLGQVAYYHYCLAKQHGQMKGFDFHVVNLNEVERSKRVNPLKAEYIPTLADASETAEAWVEAMKKGDKSSGSDQFFTQSAVNFLAACIYFFSRYEGGKYSTIPHIMAFVNRSYEEIFSVLYADPELLPLLSPFYSAYKARAFDQLEGQVGTLKIFISRLATKETFWVFGGDDINLKISDKKCPGVLVLAGDPNTQNINSACYSVVLNRMTRLLNSKGNHPSALIIDEIPTLFFHKLENLIATARSNKVAVLMGLQELPQFYQQYGKATATTIASVVGNVLSGSVRDKQTLDWLERLFGKVKQKGESINIARERTNQTINERLDNLIPAGKIASLHAGEMVGVIAEDADHKFNGQYQTAAVHCKINLNKRAIRQEEAHYKPLPVYYDFKGKKEEKLRKNYQRIISEIDQMIASLTSQTADA